MATSIRQLRQAVPIEERAAPRQIVSVTRATVRGHGQDPAEASLRDLSIYGCRLELDAAWHPDDRIWLRLDGGPPIAATVVWTEARWIGCRFDAPIATSEMRALTRSLL